MNAEMIKAVDPFTLGGPTMTLRRLFAPMLTDPFLAEAFPMERIEEGTLPVDVSETDKAVIVKASLPGFKKDDVEITVDEGVVTIAAKKLEEKIEKGEKFYRRERLLGAVSRRIALPVAVIEDEVKAELKEGVLVLILPKTAVPTPKKVLLS